MDESLGQFKSTFVISLTSLMIVLPFYLSLPLLLLTFCIIVWRQYSQLKKDRSQLLGWSLFSLYVVVVSACFQNWAGAAVGVGFFLLAIYFRGFHYYLNESFYRLNLKVIAFGSLCASLYSQIAYAIFVWQENVSWLYILQESSPRFRAESMFFNANYYGLFCLFGCLIAFYLLVTTAKHSGRFFYSLIIAANIIGLLLTASRMVWPALLMGMLGFILFIEPRLISLLVLVGTAFTGAIVFKSDWLPRFADLLYGFEDRFRLWNAGWRIFNMSPLTGRGPLNFMRYYHLVGAKATTHSHQLLIDSLASYGLYGLLLLWVNLTPYFRRLTTTIRQKQYRAQMGLVVGFWLIILTHGLMDVSILWHQTLYVALVVLYPPFMQKG